MLKIVLENLIPLLFTILTPVVVVLVHRLMKKWHLEGVLSYEGKVDEWIEQGMLAAEKASVNAVKAGKPQTPGEEKLKSVLEFVSSQLDQHGLPQKAGDAIAKMVDAKLMKSDMANGVEIPPPLPPATSPPIPAPTPTVATGK